ncbi:MAG: cytochrome c biogenesis protein CcdA [Eubacteriales bacterium]
MKRKLFFKKYLYVILSLFSLTVLSVGSVNAQSENDEQIIQKEIVYFYSSTCSSCGRVSKILNSLVLTNRNIEVHKYNIMEVENKGIMNGYLKEYGIDFGATVPIVFVSDKSLCGYDEISENLQSALDNYSVETISIHELDSTHFEEEFELLSKMNFLSVFLAGFLNGLNPCSISMLLFLVSVLITQKNNVLKICFSYIAGKYICFLLLGTVLYKVISSVNLMSSYFYIRIVMIIILTLLVIYNFSDFLSAQKEKYNKIKLQLPKKIKDFNHSLIKKLQNLIDKKTFYVLIFLIGFVISLGEFLCTGQVYLATLVTVLELTNEFNSTVVFYLIIYNLALCIPLILISLLIYKGKQVFSIGNVFLEKMHIIKLTNTVFFAIILAFMILQTFF